MMVYSVTGSPVREHPITKDAALKILTDGMACPRCPAEKHCSKGCSCKDLLTEYLTAEYSDFPKTEEKLCRACCDMMEHSCYETGKPSEWDDMFCPVYGICPRWDEAFLEKYREVIRFANAG